MLTLITFSARSIAAQGFRCASAPPVAAVLRKHAIGYGTDSAFTEMRDSLGTGVVDTAQIVIVSSDSVCNLVTTGCVGPQRPVPTSGALLVVVRIGMFYAAASGASELIGYVYILDDHFRLHGIIGIE